MPELTPELAAAAVDRGIITAEQSAALQEFLGAEAPAASPGFTFTNVLYYLGGMIALGAMTLFMTLGWASFGGTAVFLIAAIYIAAALTAAQILRDRHLPVPAGLLTALAIALVPLAIYGLEAGLGQWPDNRPYRDYHVWIDWRWIWMEIGTLLASVLVIFFYRFPFAVMPIAVTLWYMSMDFALLWSLERVDAWEVRRLVSLIFGLLMLVVSFYIDWRTRRRPDFGFWLCLFGTVAFWGAVSSTSGGGPWAKFAYGMLNVGMILAGAVLSRRVLTVFGSLGLAGYLSYLSYDLWKDSELLPFALSALGLGIIAAGIWFQRREPALRAHLLGMLPAEFRRGLGQ